MHFSTIPKTTNAANGRKYFSTIPKTTMITKKPEELEEPTNLSNQLKKLEPSLTEKKPSVSTPTHLCD